MLFYFACEAAGASAPGIPHALLMERRKVLAQLGRIRAARTHTLARRTRGAATATHYSLLATHHSSSPRTRGPITTGSSFAPMPSTSISQHERHGVWVPASAGTTLMLSL